MEMIMTTQYCTFTNKYKLGGKYFFALVMLGLLLSHNSNAYAKEVAAKAQFITGKVYASTTGKKRVLKKGSIVYSGDTITTGRTGSAQFIYKDRSRMAVRVNTSFKIEKYHFNAKDNKKSKSIFSLFGGALRSITGLIGKSKKDNVVIKTSVATIGIRGTDHEVIHITPGFNGGKPIADVGTYDKVYSGGTFMKTKTGIINIGVNEIGFIGGVPGKVIEPVRLKELPKAIEQKIIKASHIITKKRLIKNQGLVKKGIKTPVRKTLNSPAVSSRISPTLNTTTTLDSSTLKTLDTTTTLDSTTLKTLDTTTTLDSTTLKTLDPTITLDSTTLKTLDTTTTLDSTTLRTLDTTTTLDSTTLKTLDSTILTK
jgi:FecR protein